MCKFFSFSLAPNIQYSFGEAHKASLDTKEWEAKEDTNDITAGKCQAFQQLLGRLIPIAQQKKMHFNVRHFQLRDSDKPAC